MTSNVHWVYRTTTKKRWFQKKNEYNEKWYFSCYCGYFASTYFFKNNNKLVYRQNRDKSLNWRLLWTKKFSREILLFDSFITKSSHIYMCELLFLLLNTFEKVNREKTFLTTRKIIFILFVKTWIMCTKHLKKYFKY